MSFYTFVIPPLAAAVSAFALAPLVKRLAVAVGAIDIPDARKVHDRPIPRLGGIAVLLAIGLVWAVTYVATGVSLPGDLAAGILLGVLPILAVSVADDIRPLPARWKFLAHLVGSVTAVTVGVALAPDVHLFGVTIHIGLLAIPLSVLWLAGVTNAFNIIDGLDGLSAGLALISSISMAVVFALAGQPVMSVAVLVVAGALAGFLPYNVHPARMFLGDSGATAIGFCLAAFALRGGSTLSTGFAVLVPLFILGLPIADTLISMLRRIIRRLERKSGGVFEPDRNHIHHRLLALGIDHRGAVLILYGAGLGFAGLAFVSMFLQVRHAALFIASVLVAGFIGVHRLGYDEFALIRRGTVLQMYEAPVFKKSMFVVFADIFLVTVAAAFTLALKRDVWNSSVLGPETASLAVTVALATTISFWKMGLYMGSWKVAGVPELAQIAKAVALATAFSALVYELIWRQSLPPSEFVICGLVSLLLLTSSRASYVLLRDSQQRSALTGRPVIVYGAGNRGAKAVRELFDNPAAGLRPVGFVDDDLAKVGRSVCGLPVLGTGVALERLIHEHDAEVVLLTSSKLTHEAVSRAQRAALQAGAQVLRLQLGFEPVLGAPTVASPPIASTLASAAAPSPTSHAAQVVRLPATGATAAATDVTWSSSWTSEPCPRCRGTHLHRSHVRNALERFRKAHTVKRLYRCNECGWRGWLLPLERTVPFETSQGVQGTAGSDKANLQAFMTTVERP